VPIGPSARPSEFTLERRTGVPDTHKDQLNADLLAFLLARDSFWREMRDLGIEARLFHPFWSHWRGFLFRDHRKIIVIDRRITFTGGMNVGNEYGSSRHNKNTSWRDTHMRVEGPTAWEMALVFGEGWQCSGGMSDHLPPLRQNWSRTG